MSRSLAARVMRSMNAGARACPCHGSPPLNAPLPNTSKDYAFEMSTSSIRYGMGVVREVGCDFRRLGVQRVAVLTDPRVRRLDHFSAVLDSLASSGVRHVIYDQVRVEPSDASFQHAAEFVRRGEFGGILAVGGGSSIDTAKAANLYATHPSAHFLDFVNAPIGRGLPVPPNPPLLPLIACPTTSGTGSETTGVAIFDYAALGAKTGIAHRSLRPVLGLVDPGWTSSMPREVVMHSGFDVLCHALESYTALPYSERGPRPRDPWERPAYQGSNPISDVWAVAALEICSRYLVRAIEDASDIEARSQMLLASSMAGVGFGNAGVHLCHGLSYPISSLNRAYYAGEGYYGDGRGGPLPSWSSTVSSTDCRSHGSHIAPSEPSSHASGSHANAHVSGDHGGKGAGASYADDRHPLVPHGLSVILTSPSVFRFTGPACPDRHAHAADILEGKGNSASAVSRSWGDILAHGCGVGGRFKEGHSTSRSGSLASSMARAARGAQPRPFEGTAWSGRLAGSGSSAGDRVASYLTDLMRRLGVPSGLAEMGFSSIDIPDLVKGTLPQHRVTKLSPSAVDQEIIGRIFEGSFQNF
eukprot:jgi/Mesvir1/28883/Mv17980-RA.1